MFGSSKPNSRVVVVGLDGAGKTTLVKMIQEGKFTEAHQPTRKAELHQVNSSRVFLKAEVHDMAGHKDTRKYWEEHYATARGIVFVVDSADEKRIVEARKELHTILGSQWMSILKIPVLVLGNKTDLPNAYTAKQLRAALDLDYKTTGKGTYEKQRQPVELYMCSLKLDAGYKDGFRWLDEYVQSTDNVMRKCKRGVCLFS